MSYYQSGDSFQRAIAYGLFKPMRVYEEAKEICYGPRLDKMNRNESSPKHWKYCLPLWGSRNASECASATRNSLLDPRVLKPVCASAVLDMLTHDVYRTMEEVGCNPMLTFGTALGALRNGSHIPWTEDVDLAYFTSADEGHSCVESDEFSSILRSRGYFTFKHHIWRVCMTSDHPLAGQVYDISFRNGDKRNTYLCKEYGCNYVDLYAVRNSSDGYRHQEHPGIIQHDKVLPVRTATLNGASFPTFNDVDGLLSAVYGKDYVRPKARSDWIKDMGKQ
ncbi:hypothetical protein FOL47_008490 [Perkinsus chesapeaki]|uniref:LicD/FKTN/FKRP nucleotidyltransferase domain-containing protein n=1 Tax=Perkinsus chesapeaki TaxID=330153 RepID=A0A7J6LDH7_PERCH|nr:hypothetical protein FOL47_008490 [Perkinsus chesapeaki]